MQIIDNVYISDNIRFKKRVVRRFKKNKIIPGIYIIRLADKPDQLEILRADYLKQEFLREEDKIIVGFAAGYDDAVNMIVDLSNKATDIYGKPDIRAYLNL